MRFSPMIRCRAKAVDAEFGTRFAPKLKEGARFGHRSGKARRVQTCDRMTHFRQGLRNAKTSPFQSLFSRKRHLAPRAVLPSRVCDRPRRLGPALGEVGCDIWRFRGLLGPEPLPVCDFVAQAWFR